MAQDSDLRTSNRIAFHSFMLVDPRDLSPESRINYYVGKWHGIIIGTFGLLAAEIVASIIDRLLHIPGS